MARRGRKRKSGERFASGDLKPAIDRGTPEFQSRQAWAAGACNEELMKKREGKLDTTLTWHVLGILRAHDQITEDQYRAACEYRRVFCLLYRKPDVPAVSMDGVARGAPTEVPENVMEIAKGKMARFDTAMDLVLKAYGRAAKDAWDNLVVYDRTPRWMQPVFRRSSDVRESELFMRCLSVIEKAHTLRIAA